MAEKNRLKTGTQSNIIEMLHFYNASHNQFKELNSTPSKMMTVTKLFAFVPRRYLPELPFGGSPFPLTSLALAASVEYTNATRTSIS